MAKGLRKYVCEDCKTEWMEHWTARNRTARIRCPGCGSGWVGMKRNEARDDAADLLDIRKSFEEHGPSGHFSVSH